MSSYERLREMSNSPSRAERVNLDELDDDADSVENEDPDGNGNDDNGFNELSPTVSIRYLGTRSAQEMVIPRLRRLCALPVMDIVVVVILVAWANSDHAVKMREIQAGPDDPDKLTFTTVVNGASLLLQFLMGLMMTPALCFVNDTHLILCLRLYLVGCYILLVTLTIVVIMSITITSRTETFGYERWQRIVGSMMSMVLRFPAAMMVQELLSKHNGAVSSQVSYEQQRQRRRNFRRRQHNQQVAQPPLIFARENPIETEQSIDDIV